MKTCTDDEIVRILECCGRIKGNDCDNCPLKELQFNGCTEKSSVDALDLIKRQQADKECLEIELQSIRNAANSFKSRVKTLEMDNAQLHSDILTANENFDHINGLWEAEKEKVEKARKKVINVCKELQQAKAEIERLKGWQDLLKAEKHSLIKSEAIKEFAERLKAGASQIQIGGKYDYKMVTTNYIDYLVKEMT